MAEEFDVSLCKDAVAVILSPSVLNACCLFCMCSSSGPVNLGSL